MENITIREAIAERVSHLVASGNYAPADFIPAMRSAIESAQDATGDHGIDNLIDANDARVIAHLAA